MGPAHGPRRALGHALTPRRLAVFAAFAATAALVTFALLAWHHRSFTVDDAYITLRYAANLAQGHGPTWNPGDPPAEGYTTFLWMVLLTLPHLVGTDALVFAKVIGALCAIGAAIASGRLAWELARGASHGPRVASAAIALILVATSLSTAVHAVSGMETTLFTLLVTGFLTALLVWARRAKDAEAPAAPVLACALGLAVGLTRPEGNLVVGVAVAAAFALASPAARRSLVRTALAGWLLPYAGYFAWRLWYYGLPVPLSFYVKATNEPGLFRGGDEVLGLLELVFVEQLPVGMMLLVCAAARARRALPILAACLAFVLFFLLPAPIMAYERRYLYPILPALYAAAGAGVAVSADWLAAAASRWWDSEGAPRRACAVALAAMVGLAILAGRVVVKHARGSIDEWTAYGDGLVRAHVQLGHDLRERSSRRQTIALIDVGAVAYHSGWRTIDTFGLNDVHVARTGRHDPAYVRAQDPDVVVFISQEPDRLRPFSHLAWETAIHDDFVARGYVRFASYRFAPDYFLLAYARASTHDDDL